MSAEIVNPTPPYKGLMMLQTTVGRTPVGWSESLWINRPTWQQSLDALKALGEKRLALLPPTVRLRQVRVTNPQVPRSSMIHMFETFGSYEADQARFPGVSLLLRFSSHQGYHSTYRLDGLPKGIFHGAAVDEAPDAWRHAFEEYCNAVKANCVLVNRRRSADGTTTETVNPIESIQPARVTVRKRGRPFFLTRGRRR